MEARGGLTSYGGRKWVNRLKLESKELSMEQSYNSQGLAG